MKSKICFIALLFVSTILGGQTFSFECFCGYLTAADNNCDICSSSIQSRLFKGLIIRYNGTAVAWMDAPYIVKFNANTATITEIVTSRPETFSVDLAGTTIPTLAEFKDSLQCPCNNATALGWTVSDTTQYELIYGDTLYFIGGGATIVQYDSVTNTVTITTPPGSADGSETIIQEGTGIDVTGTGTIADPYIITNTGDLSNTNELQTISANGAGPTSYTVDLSSGGGAVTLAEGTGIDLTRSTNTITIAATAAGTDLSYTGTSSPVTLNSSTGTDVTITAAGINTLSATSGNLTITGTEVDGSTSNEIQNITAGDGAGDNKTLDLSLGGGTVTLDPAGVFTLARTGNTLTMTATEVDGSTSNELQTYGHAGTTSYTNTLSNGGGSFTLQAAGTNTISHSAGTTTITGTEVDGSTSNEIQAITAGDGTGDNKTLDLSLGGGTVTLDPAGIFTLARTGNTLTMTATEVDGSTSNELQTISANGAGPTSYTVDLSNGGGAVTLAEGSGIDLTRSTNTITVANTGDLSTSNEIQAITAGDGAGDNKTLDLSLGGGTVTLDPAGVFTLARTGNTLTMTATEVDGSTSNELQTYGHAGTTSYTNTLSNGGGSFTLQAAGINTISHSAGTTTITATEVDGSTSNELQTISANGAGPTSYTVDLSSGGGAVTLAEGAGIDLTRSTNTITIASTATGTVTGAENGTNIVANKVRLGGNLITAATSIEGDGNELRFFDGKFSISSWTGFANSPVQVLRVQSLEGSPTTGTTPVSDGIAEFKVHNSSGSDQSNELTIGGYATDADGIWIQARSGGNPSFEYPLSLQPRGGQLSVGRLTGLDALVTFSGIGLAGSAAAGSVLLLENSEGNGKVSMGMGSGSDNLGSEVAWFPATDGIRLTNRGTTNGTSSIRFAIGGETSDVGMMTKTGATTLGRLGMGYTNTANVHSTIQSAGSLATGYLETVGSPTFDETLHTVIYTNSTNVTWAMPSAASCACAGREYVVHHAGTAGTLTLGVSVTKGNGGNFSTLSGGEWAHIFYGTSSVRGYKLTSL